LARGVGVGPHWRVGLQRGAAGLIPICANLGFIMTYL